jgi:hypothetical protein
MAEDESRFPQLAHVGASGAAHSWQYFACMLFSRWHDGHFMAERQSRITQLGGPALGSGMGCVSAEQSHCSKMTARTHVGAAYEICPIAADEVCALKRYFATRDDDCFGRSSLRPASLPTSTDNTSGLYASQRQQINTHTPSHLHELVADRIAHERRRRGELELAHGGRAVCLNSLDTYVEDGCGNFI